MKQKVEGERYRPKCRSCNLIYQFYESTSGMKGNRLICEDCGFRWSVD